MSRFSAKCVQAKCRLNSTASVLPLKVPSTTEGEYPVLGQRQLKITGDWTHKLDQVVGKDWTGKAKGIEGDMRTLAVELQRIYRHRRALQTALHYTDLVCLEIYISFM